MSKLMRSHVCNAWCATTEHCEVYYIGNESGGHVHPYTAFRLFVDDLWRLGAIVLRIAPAREAPDKMSIPPDMRYAVRGHPDAPTPDAWLVWWRERIGDEPSPWRSREAEDAYLTTLDAYVQPT